MKSAISSISYIFTWWPTCFQVQQTCPRWTRSAQGPKFKRVDVHAWMPWYPAGAIKRKWNQGGKLEATIQETPEFGWTCLLYFHLLLFFMSLNLFRVCAYFHVSKNTVPTFLCLYYMWLLLKLSCISDRFFMYIILFLLPNYFTHYTHTWMNARAHTHVWLALTKRSGTTAESQA